MGLMWCLAFEYMRRDEERRKKEGGAAVFLGRREIGARKFFRFFIYDRPKPLTNMWYFLALNALTDVREIPVAF